MNKIIIVLGVMALLLVGSVSSYSCIYESDNDGVKEFKTRLNQLAVENEIKNNGMSIEAVKTKLKYFGPCR